jgi:hypothetical protein
MPVLRQRHANGASDATSRDETTSIGDSSALATKGRKNISARITAIQRSNL